MKDITIASSAMLVDLNIRGWTAKKQDREISNEVTASKGARTSNAGVYQKNLLAGSIELADINKYATHIRQWHAARTLPWSDSGTRLLPAAVFQDYMAEFGQHEIEYNNRVAALEAAYGQIVQAAQFTLGSMFKADDYPDISEIKHKFDIRCSFYPLPEEGDFRVDIGQMGLDDLKDRFAKQQEERIASAVGDIKDRVKDILGKIAHVLRVDADGSKGRIHDGTFESAIALCDTIATFNLTNDPELTALRKEMKAMLSGMDTSDLRKDDTVRAYAREEVNALMSKFNLI